MKREDVVEDVANRRMIVRWSEPSDDVERVDGAIEAIKIALMFLGNVDGGHGRHEDFVLARIELFSVLHKIERSSL